MPENTSLEFHPSGRKESAVPPLSFVVIPQAGAFRVCPMGAPEEFVEVFGDPERPQCSCPEFQGRYDTRSYRCPHIEAVFRLLASTIVSEWMRPLRLVPFPGNGPGGKASHARMHLKRAVRLDQGSSLVEIEFVLPIPGVPSRQTEDLANAFLASQERILNLFRHVRRAPAEESSRENGQGSNEDGAVDVQVWEAGQ